MGEATLTAAGEDRWQLSGVLDFTSVPDIWPGLRRLLKGPGPLVLSLDQVQRANSAGLVLLLEARDQADRNGCRLELENLPEDLLDLARMSQCEPLLTGH